MLLGSEASWVREWGDGRGDLLFLEDKSRAIQVECRLLEAPLPSCRDRGWSPAPPFTPPTGTLAHSV